MALKRVYGNSGLRVSVRRSAGRLPHEPGGDARSAGPKLLRPGAGAVCNNLSIPPYPYRSKTIFFVSSNEPATSL